MRLMRLRLATAQKFTVINAAGKTYKVAPDKTKTKQRTKNLSRYLVGYFFQAWLFIPVGQFYAAWLPTNIIPPWETVQTIWYH